MMSSQQTVIWLQKSMLWSVGRLIQIVDGSSHSDHDEKIEAILNFAKYNLVAEDSISADDLEGNQIKVKRLLDGRASEVYANRFLNFVMKKQFKSSKSADPTLFVGNKWTNHIDTLDQSRQAVGASWLAQNGPSCWISEGFGCLMIWSVRAVWLVSWWKHESMSKNVHVQSTVSARQLLEILLPKSQIFQKCWFILL